MGIREGVLLVFLGVNTVSDIKTKRIINWSAWVFGIFGLIYGFVTKELSISQALVASLPGLIFLVISKVTQESMGYGDGIVVLVMGIYINIQRLISSLGIALMLAAIWSIILIVLFKKKKQSEFPFLPFVLLGYIGGLFI
jgi:Type IV leader peptidase family.